MNANNSGGVASLFDNDWKKEAIKVLFLFDLIALTVIGGFAYLYVYLTPFSNTAIGAISFGFIVCVNIWSFFAIDEVGNKYNLYVFSRYNYFNKMGLNNPNFGSMYKVYRWNLVVLFICLVVIWGVANFYGKTNLYSAEFKTNVTTWLDQGKCDEIKKYDEMVWNFCNYEVAIAKENTKGVFIITSIELNRDARSCTYLFNADKSSMYFVTTKKQPCNLKVGQKVNIELHSFANIKEPYVTGGYSYELEAKPVK